MDSPLTSARVLLTVALAIGGTTEAVAQQPPDACANQVPKTLAVALLRQFPAHRLPLVSDSLAENVRDDRSRGGNGCLLVTHSDFDGDGRDDVALGLVSKAGGVSIVVAALARGQAWTVSTLQKAADRADRLYVDKIAPGTHGRTVAHVGRLQTDERKRLTCAHPGVVAGTIEASGIVYCYVNARWLYVWVSD